MRHPGSRPVGALARVVWLTQGSAVCQGVALPHGSALGYRMPPRWGLVALGVVNPGLRRSIGLRPLDLLRDGLSNCVPLGLRLLVLLVVLLLLLVWLVLLVLLVWRALCDCGQLGHNLLPEYKVPRRGAAW